ncbi:Spx/MgsR family RNA polymerase-binding regulatory protein [bacterium]|nr:Spx/MgsR family RNA polymerase-binding regulatory protein [bacterium]MBU1882979.1 Spx/MgsR family RNA polymerase-binding regulatory protein [bacterium]
MVVVNGIKNCDSVKKAISFLKENSIEYSFRDFKTDGVDCDEIKKWLQRSDINKLFNTKGTTYRKLNLKELNLDDSKKADWLCKENLLIKRPVIQYDNGIIIGYDKELYEMEFL